MTFLLIKTKNTKEIVVNHKETSIVMDGKDFDRRTRKKLELNFSKCALELKVEWSHLCKRTQSVLGVKLIELFM